MTSEIEILTVARGVLTDRQYDVFRMVGAGVSFQNIASALDISKSTAYTTWLRSSQLVKLEIERRAA